MNLSVHHRSWWSLLPTVIFSGFVSIEVHAQPAPPQAAEIWIAGVIGKNEVSAQEPGANDWILTQTNQVLRPGYRLRTGPNTRVILRWSDQSVVTFGALTEIEILPPHAAGASSGMQLFRGILSFFHRETPGRIRVHSRGTVAGVKGTEFVVSAGAEDAQRVIFSVIDGDVDLRTAAGSLTLTNRQQAFVDPGKAPILQPTGFIANNVLQWCFFYPAVLDLHDLPLTSAERGALEASLSSYRAGDLPNALANYPLGRPLGSDAERIYRAALLLSVGQVDQTEAALDALSAAEPSEPLPRLANALRRLIAAVKRQDSPRPVPPQLASEFLADSYYEQSRAVRETALRSALASARQAAMKSPDFGFAWARVAELEFSFGRTHQALEALTRSLALSPSNAQALAVNGFLLAAQNKTRAAIARFDQAIDLDGSLGNAWLGRGLCRIRRGDRQGGREDLLVAAALEPQRALLRSYLGKLYGDLGDTERATHELALAKNLDRSDPTAWLYSALLLQQESRVNEAIYDLEHSQELNDNRRLYRSKLLLDQDRAVGSANLANIYRDAGMTDWSVLEAGRAVNYDYANYSAHLFLADSYNQIRDPNLINLRYETPANSEYLLANLLAPVGAGTLSPIISQQEYSKLFEHDRLGLVSSTEYLSRGAWTQAGAQYGTFGNFSYDLEAFYRSDNGQRPNNDVEQTELSLQIKQQVLPRDTVYVQVSHQKTEGGDLFQRYDQNNVNRSLRTKEEQEPILSLGYHHEWNPGVHTLLFAARLSDTFSLSDLYRPTLAVFKTGDQIDGVQGIMMNEKYRGELTIYSGEAQQIWQRPAHNTIIGARVQWGDIETRSVQGNPSDLQVYFPVPPDPAASQHFTTDFERLSIYGYHHWEVVDSFWLFGGVAYDHVMFPENFRDAPLSGRTETVDQISPKAGVIWMPTRNTTVRGAYTRSLSGATLDQSFQLEPTQVAGFNQSFRSIIPESVAGGNSGARFETYGVSLEQKFATGTYLGITGEILNSEVHRTRGTFEIFPDVLPFGVPSGLREHLDYTEQSLLFAANQLLGDQWAVGMRYRLSDADYRDNFIANIPGAIDFEPSQHLESLLHQVSLHTIYNHSSGLFARFEALWFAQSNQGYKPAAPGDDFWQLNIFAGLRLARRKAEITVGLMNLTDQDYRLSPLNLYYELPRERTFITRLQLSF